MTFIAIILALLIEQAKPLPVARVGSWLTAYAGLLESRFNAGQAKHGTIAWIVGAVAPAFVLLAAEWMLGVWQPLLALALSVAILYLTTGFRQFSHFFTDIHIALRAGEIDRARALLADWRGRTGDRLSSTEVARLSIEEALVASHRHVFAPLFWFALLGAGGALLYRLSHCLSRHWATAPRDPASPFGEFAARAFAALDWLPSRATALAFAIVGDFEDAIYCWRTQAARWPAQDKAAGILLASGGGALGVRLGMPVEEGGEIGDRPELGIGDEADADFMQSTIGLVWRSLVLGLMTLALLWVASWA